MKAWIKSDNEWSLVSDMDLLLETPDEDMVFISDLDTAFEELEAVINLEKKVPAGVTAIRQYHSFRAGELESFMVKEETSIEDAVELIKKHKRLSLPYSLHKQQTELAKHNVAPDGMGGYEINPKIAKQILRQYDQLDNPNPQYLYNADIYSVLTAINKAIKKDTGSSVDNIRLGSTRDEISGAIIIAADLYSWFYGKGSYRKLKAFKKLKKKWKNFSNKSADKNKVEQHFVDFMNDEIDLKPGKSSKLMKRTLTYKYLS